MPVLTVKTQKGVYQVPAARGETVLAALQAGQAPCPPAPCGGRGSCGKCLVRLTGQVSTPTAAEAEKLPDGGGLRLACMARVEGDCLAELLDATIETAVAGRLGADFWPDAPRPGKLGAAVDLGTTTVALYLYDLGTGALLDTLGRANVQQAYGADVISRAQYAMEQPDGLQRLTAAIRGQVEEMLDSACAQMGRDRKQIDKLVVAGNTIMLHILAGLSPASIAVAPFTPLSHFGEMRDIGLGVPALLAPCVAGYVGGDITAGLVSSGAYRQPGPVLFVDVGTNGEMALGGRDGFCTCATAAGPALEGAEIRWGMSAGPGAISGVTLEEGQLHLEMIGDGAPRGICGSGLIDALAVLLDLGAVDGTGRLLPPEEAPAAVRPYLTEVEGKIAFRLAGEVCITSGDVRKLQLAKAAIRAGIDTLLQARGIGPEGVTAFYLAGGFGSFIPLKSAGRIGLFPPELIRRAQVVGNSSGLGASAMLLSEEARRAVLETAGSCRYLELSGDAAFSRYFMERMAFEEDEA